MYYKTNYDIPIGNVTLASDGSNLTGLWLEGQKYFGGTIKDELVENSNLKIFDDTKVWLEDYFSGKRPDISKLSLAPQGNDFRCAVWKILCEIPYGEVITYGQIAAMIAKQTGKARMSAQAIGGAVGHNPISIIIPCHRVVGTNGSLTGCAGGIDIKVKLLNHENVDMSKLFIPHVK